MPIDLKTLFPAYYHKHIQPDYLLDFQSRSRALMAKVEQMEPLEISIQQLLHKDMYVAVLQKSLADGMEHVGSLKDWVVQLQQNPNLIFTEPEKGKSLVRHLLHWYLTINEQWEKILEAPLS